MVRGKRGWGCSRWREGCAFVVWFETAGVTLSDAQLHELVVRGATRAGAGVLRLDVAGEGGARYEPA
jgi:DNA topoisomerase-3